jgi:hypothetical protein
VRVPEAPQLAERAGRAGARSERERNAGEPSPEARVDVGKKQREGDDAGPRVTSQLLGRADLDVWVAVDKLRTSVAQRDGELGVGDADPRRVRRQRGREPPVCRVGGPRAVRGRT